jgi:hypothetical protein
MSTQRHIFAGRYTHRRPYVKARLIIINEETGRQAIIEKDFWIDTGFDGGIHIAEIHRYDITMIGVNPVPGTIGVAGGRSELANRCFAYLQQIGDYEFPMPGIEVELILHGSASHGLIGLEVLRNWVIKFDGQNEFFTIT